MKDESPPWSDSFLAAARYLCGILVAVVIVVGLAWTGFAFSAHACDQKWQGYPTRLTLEGCQFHTANGWASELKDLEP